MTALLQSPWMIALVGLVSYSIMTCFSLRTAWVRLQHHATAPVEEAASSDAAWNFRNPELDQLIADLNREKEALAMRQQQLKEWDARINTECAELNQVLKQIELRQKEFDRNVVRVQEEEIPNLKKLAKVYATMSPAAVTTIFKELEDDKVVKILVFLKESEAAPILENLAKMGEAEAKRAAALAERFRLSISRIPAAKARKI